MTSKSSVLFARIESGDVMSAAEEDLVPVE